MGNKRESPFSRRSVLRNTAAAGIGLGALGTGSSSVGAVGSETDPLIEEIENKQADRLKELVLESNELAKYREYIRNEWGGGIAESDTSVYKYQRKNAGYVVSLLVESDGQPIADLAFLVQDGRIQASQSMRSWAYKNWSGEQRLVLERLTADGGESNSSGPGVLSTGNYDVQVSRAGVNLNDLGSHSVSTSEHDKSVTAAGLIPDVPSFDPELPEIDGPEDIPHWDDIPGMPDIDPSCGDCKGTYEAACTIGCGVSIGTICLTATVGIGSLACGALASVICIVFDKFGQDACMPAGNDYINAETTCSKLGFC